MPNPFEDADADYYALVNGREQYSLWPAWLDVPAGWTVVFGVAAREECLSHVERVWTDILPRGPREGNAEVRA